MEFVGALVGKAPQQKVVAWGSSLEICGGVYPIDQAERHKLDRQTSETQMAEAGMIAEEIRKDQTEEEILPRRPQRRLWTRFCSS